MWQNTAEVTAEKSKFLQQVAEYVSKKCGRGQLIVRFALAIPIKSKKGPHVAAALEKAFKVMKPPRKLQTDMEKEFYNSHVKRALNRY